MNEFSDHCTRALQEYMVVGQLPRTTALKENCPLDNFPQIIASGKLPQR